MTMVEKVASALCLKHGRNYPHSALLDHDGYVQLAVAALTAMRGPTPKMLRAAAAAMSPGKRPTPNRVSERAKHGIRYRAMIDAALKEGS